MKSVRHLTVAAALVTLSAAGLTAPGLLAACSGGAAGGSGGGAGGGGGGTSGPATCSSYCAAVMANCKEINKQYSGMAQCIASCAAFPADAGSTDQGGNSLACRSYHAGAAQAEPGTHCVHAGPGGAGVCGSDCDGFCQIAQKYCVATDAVYADLADCKATCARAGTTAKFSTAADAGIDELAQVACLLYHVQEASVAPGFHCVDDLARPPDGGLSTVCVK
jgi:hypothetical protein